MTPLDAGKLARRLWESGRRSLDVLRKIADEPTVPVGDANSKTDVPSTYRRVGTTCPSSCPMLGAGCYAQRGNVRHQQERASDEADAAIVGATIAMVSALRTGAAARLHVSGDFARDDALDTEYVDGVAAASETLRHLAKVRWTSWTYTHVEPGAWLDQLRSAGVAIRQSGSDGPWGAVVVDSPAEAEERGAVLCPHDTHGVTCAQCKLCITLPHRAIAFLRKRR